jgi:hypothetical protein
MTDLAKLRKILLFGLLGALGCLMGWLVGEGFLWAFLPSKEAGGSLASKPALPALASQSTPTPAPLPAALPDAIAANRGLAPAAPPPPPLPDVASKSPVSPAAPPPALSVGSAKPPAPPPEFAQRLLQAKAKSGDVQITLIWFNVNDLDLHCIEPSGNEIFYANRRSATGGELDVDMNAGGAITNRPVENIYWPKGKTPSGKYQVFVNHYANHGGKDPTNYKVSVLAGGSRREYSGKISRGQPKRLICEFEVQPGGPDLRLAVSPEVIVNQGSNNQLKMRIARPKGAGPVTVRFDGDLRGITARELTIPADASEATADLAADATAPPGERVLVVKASAGAITTDTNFRLLVKERMPELRLAVSPELIVSQGGKNQLKVRIARARLKGRVNLRLDGDLQGISPQSFTIAAGATEATAEIAADASARPGTRTLTLVAHAGATKADASFQLTVKALSPELRLAVSPELEVNQGGCNRMQIRVARSNLAVPIRVHIEGDLRGLSPREFFLSATDNDIAADLRAEPTTPPGQRKLTFIATAGALRAEAGLLLTVSAVPPVLRLAVPSEIQINQGGQNELPVRIARERFGGPVTIRLEGDMAGVSPKEFTLPAGREQDDIILTAAGAALGARNIQVIAVGDGASADTQLKLVVAGPTGAAPPWSWWLVLVIGMWTAILVGGLSLSLVVGQNWYLARPWLSLGQFAILALGSVLAGVLAGGIGQTLYALLSQVRLIPELGFLAGWVLLGGLLGRGVVFFIPNLSAWRATAAGGGGGLFGALAFIAVSFIGDVAGRFMGAAILGGAIGLMVALVETAFRRIWLEVVDGPRDIRAVNLGATPVTIGGDARKCTVLIAGAPGIALKFWENEGQVYCLDVLAEKTYPVSPGYCHPLKKAEVAVCSNDKGPKTHSAPPPRKPAAVAPATVPRVARADAPALAKHAKHVVPPRMHAAHASAKPAASPAPAPSVPISRPSAPPGQPASPPIKGVCPVCGDAKTGIPGHRRCGNCFTMF